MIIVIIMIIIILRLNWRYVKGDASWGLCCLLSCANEQSLFALTLLPFHHRDDDDDDDDDDCDDDDKRDGGGSDDDDDDDVGVNDHIV